HAICVRCGALAYVSHRIVEGDRRVMLGEQNEYEPLCRDCYTKAMAAKKSSDNKRIRKFGHYQNAPP
ncbi:MAG: hypothetical protein MR299_02665, partial [Bacteroidales bacterium]|nr:hypothetical protein [Bacteroidales bacterium]